ncbi:hypothetical protein B0H10DRAFT_1960893 [Mycena sp. CBHHK59/15]|nr:hypothetical protein B0H10DRAFT_1960893 [Mycena sp. CBHHK59/15]
MLIPDLGAAPPCLATLNLYFQVIIGSTSLAPRPRQGAKGQSSLTAPDRGQRSSSSIEPPHTRASHCFLESYWGNISMITYIAHVTTSDKALIWCNLHTVNPSPSASSAPAASRPSPPIINSIKAAGRDTLTSFRPINKRARPAEIGGLKTNWKKAVIIPDARGRSSTSANARARSSSRSAMRTGTSSEGDYGGTFADDEPDSTIQAAQALKPSGSASRSGGTARISWKWIPAWKFVTLKTLFGGLENDTKVRTRRLSARVMEEEERLMEALANPAEDDVPDNGAIEVDSDKEYQG